MKHLKKFENHAAYEAAESSLILPNVSLITENNTVHYNPSTPPAPAHEYVEIAGIKWATMNVGANSITDTGLYFQWGDTQGYTAAQVGTDKQFSESDCKYGPVNLSDSTNYGMTKYNNTDHKTVLESSDDAVTAAWGNGWRMPTTAEYAALGTATTSAWTADYQGSGVAGLVLTSKADSSKKLFFPACGLASYGTVDDVYSVGFYWSSSLRSDNVVASAFCLHFNSERVNWQYSFGRENGYSVRGVVGV